MLHQGKDLFKCAICDIRFAQKPDLSSHMASVHEGNYPFKCTICNIRTKALECFHSIRKSVKLNLLKGFSLTDWWNKFFKLSFMEKLLKLKGRPLSFMRWSNMNKPSKCSVCDNKLSICGQVQMEHLKFFCPHEFVHFEKSFSLSS